MTDFPQAVTVGNHYHTIAKTIEFIRSNARRQPDLQEIAQAAGLSASHLQRVFSEWAGVSPKRFLQFLTKEFALEKLKQSESLLDVALDSGLSGPGRLHDLMVTCEAMTPGEIKALGEGLQIGYGMGLTPFGVAVIGWTERGICYLAFYDDGIEAPRSGLEKLWPRAILNRNDFRAMDFFKHIFSEQDSSKPLHLLLRGTNFQLKVWEALLRVGRSQQVSYSQLARMAGSPKAHRSVGTAMAANHIAYLIPCHRVIRGDGGVGLYRWGSGRKQAMQCWEAAQQPSADSDSNIR